MKGREFFGEYVPSAMFAHWRGHPLYVFLVYLLGQALVAPPVFMMAVVFTSFVTGVQIERFLPRVAIVIGVLVASAYFFYHLFSPTIRRFLAHLIAGEAPSKPLATAAWEEAVMYPQRVTGWVALSSLFIYTFLGLLFTPYYGLSPALVGSLIGFLATVALGQVIFLFYLEWAMLPVARVALAVGASPTLETLRKSRPRLGVRSKLLMVTLLVLFLAVTVMGLFSYGQALLLGGDPVASLSLTVTVATFAAVIAALLIVLLSRSLAVPVEEIQRVVEEVRRGNLNVAVRPLTTDELAELGLLFNRMIAELREQERLKTAFGRYVSDAVRDAILSGRIQLGGERREITIMFTDIWGFTAWCERTPPESVVQTLNSYYENLVRVLASHGGTVTRYMGDGLLVLFGAPLEDPDHALHAVQAAWKAYVHLEKFNDIRRGLGALPIRTGFGIHTGIAVVGSVGCPERAEYTAVGDAVNLASRVEELTRELDATILISDATYRRVAEYVKVGKRIRATVRGRSQPVEVVEVVGLREET
ncbi:MAG TPA: adenylate/guanylate cyclase domain-containing protein [Chloroflexi bacterium]|nr:adenylate/guanylate cyclase domain-containing protein [Chloroflexota bacterium]